MNNLNFLSPGKIFPPLEEAKRIGAYAEYDLMFDGNSYAVEEKHFRQTLNNLNRLAMLLGWTSSYVAVEYNYFQLCSIKTADFVCGEIPDIVSNNKNQEKKEKQQAVIDRIRKDTKFDLKHYDGWVDVSKYGEAYLRVYAKDGKNTFTLQSPAMIIRITDEEDDYEVKAYVVAWLTENDTVLKVQIHDKGFYIEREYLIRSAVTDDLKGQMRYRLAAEDNRKNDLFTLLYDRLTDEIFRCRSFRILKLLKESSPIRTNLDDFAIIPLFNTMNSARTHGVSDYDRFDSVVSQMQRSMTEVQLVFDKYTTPSMSLPQGSLEYCERTGENVMEIGKAIGVNAGDPTPAFLEPDLSKLSMYFQQFQINVERVKELSEMGAALTSDTSVSNISTETMKATFTSALKKAERLTTRNTEAIKQLFHLISMYGYDEEIPADDISVTWYDGLPNDEEKDVRVAAEKLQSNLTSRKDEYINRFNHTEDEFDSMWEQMLQELNDLNSLSAVGNAFNPFTPSPEPSKEGENKPQDGKNDKGEEIPEEEEKGAENDKL